MSDVAAEGTGAVGTGAEVTANDLGATSTESVSSDQAEGSAQEPELYTVKVGGKTEQVTLDEALKGYQREQDYTRGKQEVARERERLSQVQQLADALERDPKGTLTALAAALRVDLGTATQVAQAVVEGEDEPWSRVERQVQQLTQQISSREQAELEAQAKSVRAAETERVIQSELATLHSRHGDFPDLELIQYAVDHNWSNLDGAYRAWQFDALDAQRIAEQNAATEAKRRAQVVGGGQSIAPNAIAPGSANGKVDIRGAFEAALRQAT